MSLFEEIFSGVNDSNKSYWDYRVKEDKIDAKNFENLIKMLTQKVDIQDQIKEYFNKNKIQINKNDIKKCLREILAEDFANEGDTYDIVRNFALEAIGVKENGKINPEFVKLVRQEMANVAAKAMPPEKPTDCKCELTDYISIKSINTLLAGYNLKVQVNPDDSFEIVRTGKYGHSRS